MEPEFKLNTLSIMFYTDGLDVLYQAFEEKGITVG
jgi:hypothetical protein